MSQNGGLRLSIGIKKLGLVKSFAFLSLITFFITGIGLSYIISRHIEKDSINNKLKLIQFALNSIPNDKNSFSALLKKNLINLNASEYYLWNNKGELLINSPLNSKEIQADIPHTELNFPKSDKKIPNYKIYQNTFTNIKTLIVRSSIVDEKGNFQYFITIVFPFEEITGHIDMLNQNIILTVTGGLLLLYILLIGIIRKASLKLIKQKNEVEVKNKELIEVYEKLNISFHSTIQVVSNAVDARDSYTAGHSNRVVDYSLAIGKKLNMTEESINQLYLAALMHDIGKIGISDLILHKSAKLSDEEYEIIKSHPQIGTDILKSVEAFDVLLPSILHHHERYDGRGYPDNLSAEAIPLNARIIAIADTFDAMTSDRPYRKALSTEKAINEIEINKGKQFDPHIASIFIDFIKNK